MHVLLYSSTLYLLTQDFTVNALVATPKGSRCINQHGNTY